MASANNQRPAFLVYQRLRTPSFCGNWTVRQPRMLVAVSEWSPGRAPALSVGLVIEIAGTQRRSRFGATAYALTRPAAADNLGPVLHFRA
jgi:hypothetical protein